MEREGSEVRTEDREEHREGSREGGRVRWRRVLYYALFVLLAAFAWYFLSVFLLELVGGAVASGSVGEWVSLALGTLVILTTIAGQVGAYAIMAYRTPQRPLVHVLLVALIVWLVSVAIPGNTFAGWLTSGLFGALWALVGLAVGVGLRALKKRSGDGTPPSRREEGDPDRGIDDEQAYPQTRTERNETRVVVGAFVAMVLLTAVGFASVAVFALSWGGSGFGNGPGSAPEGEVLQGTHGPDTLKGGAGEDEVFGHRGRDTVYAGAGDDRVSGGPGGDIVYGQSGSDEITGEDGPDTVYGGPDDDRLYSGRGQDIVGGGVGSDTIETKAGDDTVYADDDERDVVDCGDGTDQARSDSLDELTSCEESF